MGVSGGVRNASAAGALVESTATSNRLQEICFACGAFNLGSARRALAAPAATLAEALDGEALGFFGTEASPPQSQNESSNNDSDTVPRRN